MAQTSSAEPEKLFRYANFGLQLDLDLVLEAARLAVTLQNFEAACAEPGFQINAVHLANALRSYGAQCDPLDNWVRQVGRGFQMADWVWRGVHPSPGSATYAGWPLPAWATGAILLAALLPTIPAWLMRLVLSLPWLKGAYTGMPEIPGPLEPVVETKRSGLGELLRQSPEARPESNSEDIQRAYDVIGKLNVEQNERYRAGRQGKGDTYCNIYAMDYAREMGAPLPEYLKGSDGKIYDYLNANKAVMWLRGDYQSRGSAPTGPARGWMKVDANQAAELASKGHVVIAGWQNPTGKAGHMAVVRPDSQPDAIRIAQAGDNNFSNGTLSDGFGKREPIEFFVYMPNRNGQG